MLKEVIETLGGNSVAKACGVTKGAVSHWKRQGYLPGRGPRADRRGAIYERRIAKLAGITVAELREWIERKEAA
jgi:hypothetical protein